ncbi:hypothetical protein WICPIJ_001182 [Wickerhamomyces pijperi]|uniref:C2H2-type domain-containing protein n=1 Tax=Wickerhamomyces pijperi TaxID=599730 RepID=A0A9P8TQ57_WICPI|nr:hypothetical protein WICPIJ_001182 [Wickerhamomyces pijperi]
MLNHSSSYAYTTQAQAQAQAQEQEQEQTQEDPDIIAEATQQSLIEYYEQYVEYYKLRQCPLCGSNFNYPSFVIRHLKTHSKERKFKCYWIGCDKAYKASTHLIRHIQKKHQDCSNPCFLTTSVPEVPVTEQLNPPRCEPLPRVISRYVDKLVQTDSLALTILPLPILHTQIYTQTIPNDLSIEDPYEDIPPEVEWIETWTATKNNHMVKDI